MSISRWEPMSDFMTLRQAMDRLFEDSFVRAGRMVDGGSAAYLPVDVYTTKDATAGSTPGCPSRAYLPVDVYTTKDAVVIRASVPGVNPDDVEITVEGDTVTLRGEIKPAPEEGNYLLQERRYGPFARSIELAIPIQADQADATFKNGLLTLTIPKAEEIKPKVIKVKTA
jgi:HSP20 family protein